ncbi:hypothetical protein LCGC14_2947040 [marine sediment metagenome]|uniref:Uncharacterized protein n=1 Tax=marine sediment metagenome TaxID=412755 RepID=A0A0F8XG47_9ZZZZ|nr:hypothetical protein [Desulfobacterales bacterium]
MNDKWEKLKYLSLWELWFLTKAALLLPLTTLGLQLFGYKAVSALPFYRAMRFWPDTAALSVYPVGPEDPTGACLSESAQGG